MSLRFAHLHVHTDASRIDGLGTVERLVNSAKIAGFEYLAMTDHGSLANSIAFTLACNSVGIKPILGMEGYVAVDGKVCHITLLADGNEGFSSLVALNNLGQKSTYGRPAFEFADLLKHNRGLICMTGCVASPFHQLEYPDAKRLATRLKSSFEGRFFAEAMFVSDIPSWDRVERLSKEVKIPIVTTNDVHFSYKDDAPVHTVLTNLKASFAYNSKHLFLATTDQIEERIGDPDGLRIARAGFENAYRIATKLKSVEFSSKPSLPHFDNALQSLSDEAVAKMNGDMGTEYYARLETELNIIAAMGFESYFLILNDLVSYAKSCGVRVGAGRGSGVGSLILFLLGVTEIDPIKYNLSFERFLNPLRKEMPDVDLDFDSEGRHLVIDYAKSKYGAYPVATYSRYSHKTLVHDLAKYFHLPRDIEQTAADEGVDSSSFQQLAKKNPQFEQAYNAMEGQIRHIGQHAGGVIITNAEVPLERAADGTHVVAWTEGGNKELSKAGIVKFDILGLTSLSILKELETTLEVEAEEPTDDSPVFSLFKEGKLAGIFQFSGSDGIVRFTQSVEPNRFADLIAINALYRPGALDADTAKYYPKWKLKPRRIDPLYDDILSETFGIIVYQEQFIQLYAAATGVDFGGADIVRRTISKRSGHDTPEWTIELAGLHEKFVSGSIERGVPVKDAEKVWSEIVAHTRYSFNKSHATAYAKIAWQMAWFKYYHPVHFFVALLNHDAGNAQRYLFDALEYGIPVHPPHVNYSSQRYEIRDMGIVMPLSSVKYLGSNGAKMIAERRPYATIKEFMTKIPKAEVKARGRSGLYELGGFDGVEGNFEELQVKKELKVRSAIELQKEVLGFIIPPAHVLKTVKEAKESGLVAGIIIDRVDKPSRFGEYTVYYLVPQGAIWSRDTRDLDIGAFIKAKIKSDSGKILKYEELAL